MSAIVICLYARKGGSGRTTMTQNLAGVVAERGSRVLIIDQDPQGSISKNIFGAKRIERLRPYETAAGIYEDKLPELDDIIHESPTGNIFLVPASDHLAKFDLPRPKTHGRLQHSLRQFVDSVRDRFAVVLIDTPPNTLNLTAWASLLACDFVISPVFPEKNHFESVIDTKRQIQDAIECGNPDLVDLGYFLTNYDVRLGIHNAFQFKLRQLYGSEVFNTVVLDRTGYKEAVAKRLPITHDAPNSAEAKLVRTLFAEMLRRMKEREELMQRMVANQ